MVRQHLLCRFTKIHGGTRRSHRGEGANAPAVRRRNGRRFLDRRMQTEPREEKERLGARRSIQLPMRRPFRAGSRPN